jgi:hypothetical protein
MNNQLPVLVTSNYCELPNCVLLHYNVNVIVLLVYKRQREKTITITCNDELSEKKLTVTKLALDAKGKDMKLKSTTRIELSSKIF